MIEVNNISKQFLLKKTTKARAPTAIGTDAQGSGSSSDGSRVQALDNVSLVARPGAIYGLLGPNGAGKTTTLRCIATLLKVDAGEIIVNGVNVQANPKAVRAQIGLLTSDMKLSGSLSSRELMQFFGKLNRVNAGRIQQRIETLTAYLGMGDFIDQPIIKCSTGQKQKASIAVALVHDPDVIIFDEPTSGLDILTAKTVVDFLLDFKKKGKTIIVSTHIMSEAETLCDKVGIMLRGKLVSEGTQEEILSFWHAENLADAFFKAATQYGVADGV